MNVETTPLLSGVERPMMDAPAPQPTVIRGNVFLVANNPSEKAHVTFSGRDFKGKRPEALRIAGQVYAMRSVTGIGGGPKGAQGGQLKFVAEVPVTQKDGKPTFPSDEVKAEVKIGGEWIAVVLSVTRFK